MKPTKTFILLLTITFSGILFSQDKNEFEERIPRAQFPEKALVFLTNLPNNYKRLKLLRETDGDKISYEAKFKLDRKQYSVEFNKNGILEDIEILIKKRQISKDVLSTINNQLKKRYTKYRFLKIQKQYKNTLQTNNVLVLDNALNDSDVSHIFFEIIVEGKSKGKRELFEITFSRNGKLISLNTLTPESYEHVLY